MPLTSVPSACSSRLRMLWLALPLLSLGLAGCGNSISSSTNITQTATTTVVAASVTSLPTTATTTLSAVVTNSSGSGFGAPTGTVTFFSGGTNLGCAGPNGSGCAGTAVEGTGANDYQTSYSLTLAGSAFPSSTNVISATFNSDEYHTGSTSSNVLTVSITGSTTGGIATTTALNATASSQSTLLTATITPASGSVLPEGVVAFLDVTNPKVPITIAQANLTGTGSTVSITVTTTNLGTGAHSVEAEYLGGTNGSTTFAPSNSSVLTVTAGSGSTGTTVTTTAITAASTSITTAQSTVLTATIASSGATTYPTGTVTFYDQTNSAALGIGTLSNGTTAGTATATLTASGSLFASNSTGEPNLVVAQYSGDSTFAASTSASVTVTVAGSGGTGTGSTQSTTVVTASPASIAPGGCTNITVEVSGTAANVNTAPTGNVSLTINGLPLSTVTVNYSSQGVSYGYTGICSNPGTVLGGSGSYSIVGVYTGDENYTGSTNTTPAPITVTGDEKADVNIQVTVPQGTSSTIALGSCGSVQSTVAPVAEPNGTAPTGSAIYYVNYSTQIGSAVPLGAGGVTTEQICTGPNTAITAKGSYTINADYTGDNYYNAAASDQNATLIVD